MITANGLQDAVLDRRDTLARYQHIEKRLKGRKRPRRLRLRSMANRYGTMSRVLGVALITHLVEQIQLRGQKAAEYFGRGMRPSSHPSPNAIATAE
jgi:hypothetical protein